MVMCSRTDFPPYDPAACPECGHLAHEGRCPGFANCGCETLETDAREDAVCPTHGPNLYACPEGCAFAAAFPRHPRSVLVGGMIPAHEPGAYPSLSCCAGPVVLVPAHDDTHADPLIESGPGWGMAGSDRDVIDAEPEHGEALLFLEARGFDANTATRAELYIVARPIGGNGFRYETGAELTVDDLAQLIYRAASIGEGAAIDEERHFAAEAFARVRDHITRIVEPVGEPL